jgi:CRP-like cAMP-binding protein
MKTMALDIVVQSLLKVELFAGLRPLQVAEIARQADRIVYRPGQSIITEGEPGDAAVLIVKGDAVRIAAGSPATPVQAVPDGSLVGELAMLIETLHGSTVVARGVTRAIRIGRAALHEQMAQDPAVAITLASNMSNRLTAVAQELSRIDRVLEAAGRAALPADLNDGGLENATGMPGNNVSDLALSGLTARGPSDLIGNLAQLVPMTGAGSRQLSPLH